jgi:hypothetical protein
MLQLVVEFHDRSLVAHSIAVVRCGPHGDQLFIEPVLESFLNELMSSADYFQVVDVAEILGDFGPEEPAGASRVGGPGFNFLGVTPEQVGESSLKRDLDLSLYGSYLVDGFDVWTETTVNTEHTTVDEGAEREVIEHVREVSPGVDVAVLAVDFVVEPVGTRGLSGLVVASQKGDAVGVVDLQEQQQFHGFN